MKTPNKNLFLLFSLSIIPIFFAVIFLQTKRGVKIRNSILIRIEALQNRKRFEQAFRRDYNQLFEMTKLEQVSFLKNEVYKNVTVEVPDRVMPFNMEIYKRFRNKKIKAYCSEMTILMAAFLEELDIPYRRVILGSQEALDKATFYNTHVALEVLIKGKWIFVDPTYNNFWKEKEKLLNIHQIRSKILSGQFKMLTYETKGYKTLKDREPDSDYPGYFKYIEFTDFDPFIAKENLIMTIPQNFSWREEVFAKQKKK